MGDRLLVTGGAGFHGGAPAVLAPGAHLPLTLGCHVSGHWWRWCEVAGCWAVGGVGWVLQLQTEGAACWCSTPTLRPFSPERDLDGLRFQ